jgi:hypothetical protein
MTERFKGQTSTQRDTQPTDGPGAQTNITEEAPADPPEPALLALLILDGVLLGGFGLMFTPLYVNGVPAPMGIVLSVIVLPWLVRQAGEIIARPIAAATPLIAWVVTVVGLGLFGPGGDVMLRADVLSLLLLVGGLGAGLWALRGVMEENYRRRAGG